MDNTNLIDLTMEEMVAIDGGGDAWCFAAGAITVLAFATLNPVAGAVAGAAWALCVN